MSRLDDVQYVCIIDNKNTGNYSKMIDAFKPKNAQRCFICVEKFQASVDMDVGYNQPSHNIVLSIQGAQNSYVNDPPSGIVVRSTIVDSFMTNTFNTTGVVGGYGGATYAIYNVVSCLERWIEIPLSDLNSFKIQMSTASNQTDLNGRISYSAFSGNTFQFFLHLKVKFE